MIAVIRTPISRKVAIPTKSTVKTCAPKTAS